MSWNKGNGAAIQWIRDHVGYQEDDCLTWPFSKHTQGYGHFGHLGQQRYAHRTMCELAHGPAPTPKHQASHSCGKGHEGCTNPRHLSWKINSENQIERRKHGTNGGGKGNRTHLTPAQIAEIRALRGIKSQPEIAEMFGVKRGCIYYWHRYDHQPAPPGMSPDAVRRRSRL